VPIWEGSRLSFFKYDIKKWRTAYIQSTAMIMMMMMMIMMMVVVVASKRGLQTSQSPHENSVWHTIHNSVSKKTQKHNEFNKKRNLKEKTQSFQS